MKEWLRWIIYGTIFGTFFPLLALFLEVFIFDIPIHRTIWALNEPLHWIVLSAPLVLGSVGSLIGIGRDRLSDLIKSLKNVNKSLEGTTANQESKIQDIMEELSYYSRQIENINNNVNNGICVIDKDFRIGIGYNKKFQNLFGHHSFLNMSIFDTIFKDISEREKEFFIRFLEVAFENTITSDEMLDVANPFDDYEYSYEDDEGTQKKYLSIKVVRLKDSNDKVINIMLIFDDYTSRRILEKTIEQEKEKFQNELSLVTSIFHNDIGVVFGFLENLETNIAQLKSLMDEINQGENNSDTLQRVQEIVHSIKGESLALGFQDIFDITKECEGYCREIKDDVTGTQEKSTLTLFHEKLSDNLHNISTTLGKITAFADKDKNIERDSMRITKEQYRRFLERSMKIVEKYNFGTLNVTDLTSLHSQLEHLTWKPLSSMQKELEVINTRSSKKIQKETHLHFTSDIEFISHSQYHLLKNIFIHLIRNSITHGIEAPEVRTHRGKDSHGNIAIRIEGKNSHCIVTYADDGQGLNYEKVKKKIIEQNLVSEEKRETMSKPQLLKFIFHPGFSTHDKVDDISGVGVGMSAVKNFVTSLKGKIHIKDKGQKGLEFVFTIPMLGN